MNIAFEISPLITASGTFGDKSGVYRYTYGLLKSLIHKIKKDHPDDKLFLFTFNGGMLFYSLNPELAELIDNKQVFLVGYTEKLVIPKKHDNELIEYLSFPLIKYPLKLLDKMFGLRQFIAKKRNDRAFRGYVEQLKHEFTRLDIDVVYHSETGFFPIGEFKNVITVYDLTTELLPSFHREATCDLQSRKLRFAKKYCDGVVTISKATQDDLKEFSPHFKKKKMIVAYPGLDETFEQAESSHEHVNLNDVLKSKSQTIQSKKYLLYYGTFEPRKNIVYIIRAFAALYEKGEIPQDFKMVLIGGQGWGNIKEMAIHFIKENYPLPEHNPFIILDYVSDTYLKAIIKNAYAVVYPSIYEGFGLPVLESMALGTQVICSDGSSLPEVGGEAAIYVNPKNFEDVKEKMRYVIAHPEIMEELSKKSIEQAHKFKWADAANDVYDLLHNL
ncbi:hypothetical protein BH09PAT2_BH09PAT2_05360 [soil metagenome]